MDGIAGADEHLVVVVAHPDDETFGCGSGFVGSMPPGALAGLRLDRLAGELAGRLAELRPDVVLTLDGSDGHRDHLHVRDALALAVARLPIPPRVVHSCLANSLMREWVHAMVQARPPTAYLDLDLDALGRPDADLTRIDTSAVLAVREAAIACHRSQASPFDDLPAELGHRFLTVDHVVAIDRSVRI